MISPVVVTIVVPVYNGEQYIRDTLVSILDQSYEHVECIVVDDGSIDRTVEVCNEFSNRITVFSKANGGQSDALNFGWSKATGKYLSYLSADDLLDRNAIRILLDEAERFNGDLVIYPKYKLIDFKGAPIKNVSPLFTDKHSIVERFYCPVGPGAIFSRGLFDRSGGWRTDIRQIPDFEFWLRLINKANFVFHDEVLASFRVHANSTTHAVSDSVKADESINVAVSLKKSGAVEGFRYNRFLASAYIFSGCLHLRSGRVSVGTRRLLKAFALSFVTVISGYSIKRILSSCTSLMRYK
ncbi:glycosyltransferase [Halopseudomonas pelagia]|uniref:Glycosyltransferase n=1 Tax=Halopseudomonas pelagia TaxID=553151 RepID=A0AA91U0V1_9GAMM|nr:glycosyltransferase [Halopseudomonas pelagia]PCC98437.1 hypothetical protein CO192_15835 [Halopseudomonas pelagia]QFY57709.1 glycosyltransferase [Halopseudomonas pelagia]